MTTRPFELICEVEPATRPDLMRVRHQIAVMNGIADAFLVPDNHIGRATVSSIAVAREIALMGGRAIACLNARDRNVLGFRRDLLTSAAYGVDEFLFVYGDRPESGKRSDDLTVRAMIEQVRTFGTDVAGRDFRVGVATGLGPLPAWKRDADYLVTQVSFSVDDLVAWRETLDFDGPVYAGVMVVASGSMARKLAADVPQLTVPDEVVARVDADRFAGVDIARDLVVALAESGRFDGVHLVPVAHYRRMTDVLEEALNRRSGGRRR
jgi:5,10-methylenetetrahydrofolate reductase